jgi:hypothetical protein
VPVAGSQLIYNARHGAIFIEANPTRITFQYENDMGVVVDTYRIDKPFVATHWIDMPLFLNSQN